LLIKAPETRVLRRHSWGNSTGGVGALPIAFDMSGGRRLKKILEVFFARGWQIWSKFLKSKDTSAFFDTKVTENSREYE
jgi:hypothetical protein